MNGAHTHGLPSNHHCLKHPHHLFRHLTPLPNYVLVDAWIYRWLGVIRTTISIMIDERPFQPYKERRRDNSHSKLETRGVESRSSRIHTRHTNGSQGRLRPTMNVGQGGCKCLPRQSRASRRGMVHYVGQAKNPLVVAELESTRIVAGRLKRRNAGYRRTHG